MLCTGNVCRSPLAESLLRQALAARALPVAVRSAGLLSDGRPVPRPGLEVAAARGFDLSAHESRRMTAAVVRDADLILGMARQHVLEAVALDPEVWPKAFTLKELVRRGEAAGARPADVAVEGWLDRLHDGRRRDELLGESVADDVADPIGRPRRAYEQMAVELDDLVGRLVDLLWPASP